MWKAVNVDEKENAHFVDDFQLVTKAVVLVEYRAGTIARWENLDKIWTLVRNKENFVEYVQSSDPRVSARPTDGWLSHRSRSDCQPSGSAF